MKHQELIFGVTGQSLYYDAPEGVPSSVGVEVFRATDNDTGNVLTASAAAAVDPVSTTFTGAAGSRILTVASTSGITRKRRFLVTAPSGDHEVVEVMNISGLSVGVRQPLVNTYGASSTFQGCRITAAVDPTWVADQSNISDVLDLAWLFTQRDPQPLPVGAAGFRARWTYTANGEKTLGVGFFDLVRYQAKNLVSPLDVDGRFAGWIDRLPIDYREDQGEGLIGEALRALKLDLMVDNQALRRIRDVQVISELLIYRANLIAAEAQAMNGSGDIGILTLAQKLYAQRYDQLLREVKVAVDQGGAGANDQGRRLPAFIR